MTSVLAARGTGPGPGRRARRIATIALVSVAGLELVVRLVGLAPPVSADAGYFVPHPALPYVTAPDARFAGRAVTDEFDYEYVHNARGLRDVDRPLAKPAGVFRILGLGDSFTYGAAAPFEETYLRRLELALREARPDGPPIEVVKAGIPRYFPEAERLFLEHEGLRYEPDLVIVGFLPNDVMDQFMGLEAVAVDEGGYLKSIEARELGPLGTFLYLHSHVARTVLRKVVDRRMAWRYPADWKQVFVEGGRYEEAWRAIEREFAAMNALVRARGASLVILHIPISPVHERTIGVDDPAGPARRLARWCDEHDVLFVDAQPAIVAERDVRTLYWPREGHCTPAGYEVIARVLTSALEGSGRIPRND